MSESMSGAAPGGSAQVSPEGPAVLEELDEAECLRLISPGGIGRIAFTGRFGPTVLPVNYRLHQGTIVFRTVEDSPTDEDLRTGIANAEYKVAFEIDDFSPAAREGWSVLIQGALHHVESEAERASVRESGVEPWASGSRELYLRVIPSRTTGRRISRKPTASG
jgi:nitroimidazol reductase NimA-like FMN-containing flavoprotein (pyridoxamine 5'-phosphate oxidase superfamily)